MATMGQQFGVRRVYEAAPKGDSVSVRLSDREVQLGSREFALYEKLAERVPSVQSEKEIAADLGMDEARLRRLTTALESAGLLYRQDAVPATLNGVDLHTLFNKILPSWLDEAFSHPFWERMTSGNGSRRMYSGWLIELYHYTRNANRHMPLSCAYTKEKAIKNIRAKHYAEEWNHYHYFLKALKALGFSEESVVNSVPLPMSLALSNFMRQAAREDILAYSICSAVLEGTTVNRGAYNPYYEKCAELYKLPQESIAPIYAHLDLDVQYQHSDLFLDILNTVKTIPAARAGRVLEYGHQLVEHIWLWTDSIEKYYGVESNLMPRPKFSKLLD
jgi:thiaminase